MNARDQVLKMLRQAATGQQVSTEELLRLAAAIEEREMLEEQQQPESAALPEAPAPVIPSLDEAIAVASERKGINVIDPTKLARMKFEDAANVWYEANRHRWRPRMVYGTAHAIKKLGKFSLKHAWTRSTSVISSPIRKNV